jgi:hypothetical protein
VETGILILPRLARSPPGYLIQNLTARRESTVKQVKVSADVFGSSVGHTFYECDQWKIAIRPATPARPVDEEIVASLILAIMANPAR